MARSYSRVVRGYRSLDDDQLGEEFGEFAARCTSDGGTVQIKATRDGDFELTCSVLEVGAFGERE